jgi:hypothetical protein
MKHRLDLSGDYVAATIRAREAAKKSLREAEQAHFRVLQTKLERALLAIISVLVQNVHALTARSGTWNGQKLARISSRSTEVAEPLSRIFRLMSFRSAATNSSATF